MKNTWPCLFPDLNISHFIGKTIQHLTLRASAMAAVVRSYARRAQALLRHRDQVYKCPDISLRVQVPGEYSLILRTLHCE